MSEVNEGCKGDGEPEPRVSHDSISLNSQAKETLKLDIVYIKTSSRNNNSLQTK